MSDVTAPSLNLPASGPMPRRRDGIRPPSFVTWTAVGVVAGVSIGAAAARSPVAAFVAVAGALLLAMALTSVYRAFLLFLFASTLVPHFVSFRIATVTFFSARAGMLLLAAALAIRWLAARGRFPSFRTALNPYLYAFVGVMAVSLGINAAGMSAAQLLAGIRVCLYFVVDYVGLFLATILVVRLTSRRSISAIFGALIAILSLAAALGIIEYFTGTNSFQAIERYAPSLLAGRGEEWGEYLTTYRFRGTFLRSSSTFSHFLDFGAAMAMGLPLTAHFLVYGRRGWPRAAALVALALQAAGLVFAFSRGALLAVAIAFFAYLLLTRTRKGLAAALGGVLLVGGLLVALPQVTSTMLDVFFPAGGYRAEGSIRDRLDDYAPMAAVVKEQPLLGLGPGMLLRQGFVEDRPHLASLRALDNYYLIVLGETGVIGFGVFLLLCWRICRLTWAPDRHAAPPDDDARSLSAAVVASSVAFLFLSATFDAWGFSSARVFWIVVALGVVAHDAAPRAGLAFSRRQP